jgi:arginine decarboxylase
MLEGKFEPMRIRVLVIDDELRDDSADGRAARALVADMRERNLEVVEAISAADGMAVA